MNDCVAEVLDIVVRSARLGNYDSNVIGMAAEIIAEEDFGMTKSPRGSRDVDGSLFRDGKNHTVQVKAWSESRIRRYRHGTFLRLKETALPDVLLCLLIYCSKPGYAVLYNGSPTLIGYVEKTRPSRAVRFDSMQTRDEIDLILDTLSSGGNA